MMEFRYTPSRVRQNEGKVSGEERVEDLRETRLLEHRGH